MQKAIKQMFAINPSTLNFVSGAGRVYSAGIISDIGNVNRFQFQPAVAKDASLTWKQYQSDDFAARQTHLPKSRNRFLRYYLLDAAKSLIVCCSEFRRYYDFKHNEV